VPVDAIDRDVQLAADEPLRLRRLPVEDLLPRPVPVELLREALPEADVVPLGLAVDRGIRDVRALRELPRRRELALLLQEGLEDPVISVRHARFLSAVVPARPGTPGIYPRLARTRPRRPGEGA